MINPNIGDPLIYSISGWSNHIKSIPIPIPPYPRSKPPHAPTNQRCLHRASATSRISCFQSCRKRGSVISSGITALAVSPTSECAEDPTARMGKKGAEVIGKTREKRETYGNIRIVFVNSWENHGKSTGFQDFSGMVKEAEHALHLKLVWYWFWWWFRMFQGEIWG